MVLVPLSKINQACSSVVGWGSMLQAGQLVETVGWGSMLQAGQWGHWVFQLT
jgi:hypothetical protein